MKLVNIILYSILLLNLATLVTFINLDYKGNYVKLSNEIREENKKTLINLLKFSETTLTNQVKVGEYIENYFKTNRINNFNFNQLNNSAAENTVHDFDANFQNETTNNYNFCKSGKIKICKINNKIYEIGDYYRGEIIVDLFKDGILTKERFINYE